MTTYLRGLDSQTRALVERLSGTSSPMPSLEDMRAPLEPHLVRELAPRTLLDVADLMIPGEASVPIRVFVPRVPAPRPVLIWLHPGGFVAGEVNDVDGVCRILATDGRCTVIAIGYRLAPEHPFPAGVDDVMAVVEWIVAHAGTLGVDPERFAIGGQSAGATIAASATLRLRDEGGPRPAFQVLAYPVLDPALDKPSHVENDQHFLFTTQRIAWCWKHYFGGKSASPLAAPLTAPRLDDLPPALILAAGFDPSRDDSRLYHERLIDEGTDSELVEYPHTIHAFLSFAAELDVAWEALDLIAARLRERLRSSGARLHHVAVPYAAGAQDQVRQFYGALLGLKELPIPEAFAERSFVWFAAGTGELHLIPEPSPARDDGSDRHACLSVDRFDEILQRLEAAEYRVERYDLLADRAQAFVHDPFGNLVELTN
jgi:acetyl esterase/lipase/catechol 2,3-dioxygenase-like lactoylglutathione lyase family enzyme